MKAIAENLRVAFVVGKSTVVGGITTDIVVLVGKFAHVQLWIGSDDKLPRMARAIFLEDPARYRHTAKFSDWKNDPPLAADAFAFTAPAGTTAYRSRRRAPRKRASEILGEHDEQEAASSRRNRHRNTAGRPPPGIMPAAGAGDRSSWSAHSWRGGTAPAATARGARPAPAAGPPAAATDRGAPPAIAAARRAAAAVVVGDRHHGSHYYGGPDYNHGGYYGAYNAPTVVNAYGANCYNCGGWNTGGAVAAGMLAGAAVGAAAASSANNQAAYSAGVVLAGAASATVAANPPGTLYGTLPAGCTYKPIGSQAYYSCTDGLWFMPAYGANGVYYRVVTAP